MEKLCKEIAKKSREGIVGSCATTIHKALNALLP
jgi:hypothetical protein